MNKKLYVPYSLSIVLVMVAFTPFVFAEVTDIQTSSKSFFKEPVIEPTMKKINFIDPSKDPQYYLDRYYNEPEYKSWFDRNYPHYTIEEAVDYRNQESKNTVTQFMENEIIPEADAASLVQPKTQLENNAETAQIVLAVGGLGILFGAVYGIKRKVDNNSRQISINKNIIRKKLLNPLMGASPYDILKTRLAKGEISLEEFDRLERKLNRKS